MAYVGALTTPASPLRTMLTSCKILLVADSGVTELCKQPYPCNYDSETMVMFHPLTTKATKTASGTLFFPTLTKKATNLNGFSKIMYFQEITVGTINLTGPIYAHSTALLQHFLNERIQQKKR